MENNNYKILERVIEIIEENLDYEFDGVYTRETSVYGYIYDTPKVIDWISKEIIKLDIKKLKDDLMVDNL